MVAVSLLKHVCALQDYEEQRWGLQYLRTRDGDEVDFCLVHNDQAEQLIEVKMADADLPAGLRKFYRRYAIPVILLVKELKREQVKEGITVMEAEKFLKGLYL